MLSARAYSFRQKSKLAVSLSWIGGYVNVVLFLAYGSFVSNMTGNATRFGELMGEASWHMAVHFALLVVSFCVGAASSGVMTDWAQRNGVRGKYVLPMAVEGVVLSILSILMTRHFAISGGSHVAMRLLAPMAAFAMGLQNATITEISGAVIRTTHLTGVVTDFGLEGARFLNWWRHRAHGRWLQRAERLARVSRRHPSAQRLVLLFCVFWSFVIGALAGSWIFLHYANLAMAAPVAFLVAIIVMDRRKPIADVREIDLLGDPELSAEGILRSLLPAEMGIYRLSHRRDDVAHRPPDFVEWLKRVPAERRVIVLAVSAMTRFDEESVLGLREVIGRMRGRGQELVISGLTEMQYRVLVEGGVLQVTDAENLCADLDVAFARGVELLQDSTKRLAAADARAGRPSHV